MFVESLVLCRVLKGLSVEMSHIDGKEYPLKAGYIELLNLSK